MPIISTTKNIGGIIFSRKVIVVRHCLFGIPNHFLHKLTLLLEDIAILIKAYVIWDALLRRRRDKKILLLVVLLLVPLLLRLGDESKSCLVTMLLLSTQELIKPLISLGRVFLIKRVSVT
jgi:hypothetical protein